VAEDLIEQVKEIEAEADRIVAEAREKAREMERSVAEDISALRGQYEDTFRQEMEGFKAEEQERTVEEQAELDRKAEAISEQLRSMAPDAASRAVELVLKHLREGQPWR
jgi:F0F1-type ATP synthase membrane subunit b/b'